MSSLKQRHQRSLWLIACEPSGDALGQHLMRVLQEDPEIAYTFQGVGGPLMEAQGLHSLFPYTDLSVMGFVEVLPHLPKILKRRRDILQAWRAQRPDLLLTIDASGFNVPMARHARREWDIPTVHAVAPSVWAWKPGRAKKMARCYDHMLALFPFEPPYFEKEGLACTFMGHPAGIGSQPQTSPDALQAFRTQHHIDVTTPVLTLWPGSRHQEIKKMLPLFVETFRLLHRQNPLWVGLVSTLDHLKEVVQEYLDPHLPLTRVGPQEKSCAMMCSTAALATSGTVTLELACASVPMVVGYRAHPLSYFLARRWVRTPYISLPNVIMNAPVVPEQIQDQCTPEIFSDLLKSLLNRQHPDRLKQIQAFQTIKTRITPPDPEVCLREPLRRLLIKR